MNEIRWYTGVGLSALSALLLLFAFPSFDINLLAFVALVPVLFTVFNSSLKRTFGYAVIFSFLFFCLLLFWMNAYLAVVGVAFVTVAYGIFFIGSLLIINITARAFPAYRALLVPFIWIGVDFIRSFGFLGMTFGSIGYSQHDFLRFIQVADIGGEQLVSFLIVLFNAALADTLSRLYTARLEERALTLRRFGYSRIAVLAGSVLLILFSLVYGSVRLNEPVPEGNRLKLALIQSMSSPRTEWKKEKIKTLERLIELSLQSYEEDPELDMVVWTETAIRTSLRPNFIQASPYHMRIRRLVQELGVPFIIGSPDNWTVRAEDGEVREGVNPETLDEIYPTKEEIWTNSAYLVAPDGEIVEKYDKIQLTPFGEHFPLGQKVRFLGRILENFTDSADFTPGDEYTVFKYGDIPFSTVICWEGAYGYYIRRFVNNGADFMLNISNDMWSGTHAGHFQHFNMTKFRPIENRIWYARAGNDGVTAVVDPYGRITGMIPIKKTGYLIGEVGPRIRETFYTRHGNILPAASLAVIVLALGFGIFLLVTGRRDALRETDRVSEALRNWASGAAGARSSYTGGGAGLPRITDGHRRRRGRGPGTAGRKG